MWTKRNDRAQKSERVGLNMPKKGSFEKKKGRKRFDHSFVFYFLHLLFCKNENYLKTICFLPWGPTFFLLEHLFCLSHRNSRWTMSVDNVGLKICLLGTTNSTVTLTFLLLGVNRSGLETNSTTNHKFYRTLGGLHDP
jgi:hypothetical protein